MPAKYSSQRVMNMLLAFYRQHGRWPTQNDTRGNPSLPAYATIREHYRGLPASRALGLLMEYYLVHEDYPSRRDLEVNSGLPDFSEVDQYLGGLERAHRMVAAELNVDPPPLSLSR